MLRWPAPLLSLFGRFFKLLNLFFVCRLLFLVFNYSFFRSLTWGEYCISFIAGIRFDLTALVIVNSPLIVLHLLPQSYRFFTSKAWQWTMHSLFLLINIPLLLLNCIDIGLFGFTGKRATADALKVISFGEDFANTAPKMIGDYWYLLLLFFFLSYLLVKFKPLIPDTPSDWSMVKKIMVYFLVIALTVIGFRGGVQLKPLNIIGASRYGNQKMAALILNTPFTVVKTIGRPDLQLVHFMDDKVAEKISPVLHLPSSGEVKKLNVVVLILESFSREYIGYYNNGKGYTPFLDKLIAESKSFPNAFANGKRSIEGIPSILAGIPAMMNDPFITSAYSGNTITSLANILKKEGYSSTFYHGGTNGTMGFDNFCFSSGFDRYFGRTEYGNDADFDGSWGIYDEPFLQRCIQEMNKNTSPFLSAVFTISSHHPYKIPAKFEKELPEGSLPIHRSVRYADHALEQFFLSAKKQKWFDNTLFIVTADHTALSEIPFYQSRAGIYAIPILYYAPKWISPSIDSLTTQQIDILPSVLDFLHYPSPYFTYGKSVFSEKGKGSAINFLNETYQLISGDLSLIMDPSGTEKLFRYTTDITMNQDLSDSVSERQKMKLELKAFVQNYCRTMISNQMSAERFTAKHK